MSKIKIFLSPEKWYYTVFIFLVVVFSVQLFLHYRNQVWDSFDFGLAVLADEMWEEINQYGLHGNEAFHWSPSLLQSFGREIEREFIDETFDSRLNDIGFLRITDLRNNFVLYESPDLKNSGIKIHDWVKERWDYKLFETEVDGKLKPCIGYLDIRLGQHIFLATVIQNKTYEEVEKNLLHYQNLTMKMRGLIKRSAERLSVQFPERLIDSLRIANACVYIYFYEKDSLVLSPQCPHLKEPPFFPRNIYDKTYVATFITDDGEHYRQRSEFSDHYVVHSYKIDIIVPEKSVRFVIIKTGLFITLTAILLIVLVGIGGYSIRRKSRKQIDEVIGIVNDISSKSIDRQIPSANVNEPISSLIKTFNHLLNRLSLAFKQQKAFIADTSHELRTPLSIMNLDISEALRKTDENSDIVEHLKEAKREIGHLTRIVNDMQWLAKNDSGQLYFEKSKIRLDEVFIESVSRCQVLSAENNIQLKVGHLDIVEYYGDQKLLVRAYSNLIGNAIKYSKPGGVVTMSLISENGTIYMRVEDEGIGISEDSLSKVFDRFYRVDKSRTRKTGGSGLGLTIAMHIAELHGGTITVKSVLGKGSVFTIELHNEG